MRNSIFLATLLALEPIGAAAQDNAAARSLAATCANCHGTDGRSVTKEVPSLAALPKQQIVAQMRAFKDGSRSATVMHQLAKGFTDQQIELMADYFAARK